MNYYYSVASVQTVCAVPRGKRNEMHSRFSLLRLAAVAVLIYTLAVFTFSVERLYHAQETVAALEREHDRAEEENRALKKRMESAKTAETMQALARERLGLVMPGEKIFYFSD